jgi:hypothetical protein
MVYHCKVVELTSVRDDQFVFHHVPRMGNEPRHLPLDGSDLDRPLMVGDTLFCQIGIEGHIGNEVVGEHLKPVYCKPEDRIYVGRVVDVSPSDDSKFNVDVKLMREDVGDHVRFGAYWHEYMREG